jgi:hypothetical protein
MIFKVPHRVSKIVHLSYEICLVAKMLKIVLKNNYRIRDPEKKKAIKFQFIYFFMLSIILINLAAVSSKT